MKYSSDDVRWMRQARRNALRAWGLTSPNPLVGAVVVNGDTSWSGWHRRAGEAHAEINALQAAGNGACGASLFVTLEPCSTSGRTPPCTKALIDAGISRVVIGTLDPNPKHAGHGVEVLKSAGIEVVVGVDCDACSRINEAFNCWIRYKRPYVLLKMAMTLDGKIATASGDSQWITGVAARNRVQRYRRWADAIMVGGATVRHDDPSLLVRKPRNWSRQPLRIIASHSGYLGKMPKVTCDGFAKTRIVSCRSKGDWIDELQDLGRNEISALLVEGGGELAAELLRHGLVDKVAFFISPKILAGSNSRSVVGGLGPDKLSEALPLTETEMYRIGDDFLMTGYLTNVHRYC